MIYGLTFGSHREKEVFVFEYGSLKVSSSCHLREFLLTTVTSDLLRDLNLYMDYFKLSSRQCLLVTVNRSKQIEISNGTELNS